MHTHTLAVLPPVRAFLTRCRGLAPLSAVADDAEEIGALRVDLAALFGLDLRSCDAHRIIQGVLQSGNLVLAQDALHLWTVHADMFARIDAQVCERAHVSQTTFAHEGVWWNGDAHPDVARFWLVSSFRHAVTGWDAWRVGIAKKEALPAYGPGLGMLRSLLMLDTIWGMPIWIDALTETYRALLRANGNKVPLDLQDALADKLGLLAQSDPTMLDRWGHAYNRIPTIDALVALRLHLSDGELANVLRTYGAPHDADDMSAHQVIALLQRMPKPEDLRFLLRVPETHGALARNAVRDALRGVPMRPSIQQQIDSA